MSTTVERRCSAACGRIAAATAGTRRRRAAAWTSRTRRSSGGRCGNWASRRSRHARRRRGGVRGASSGPCRGGCRRSWRRAGARRVKGPHGIGAALPTVSPGAFMFEGDRARGKTVENAARTTARRLVRPVGEPDRSICYRQRHGRTDRLATGFAASFAEAADAGAATEDAGDGAATATGSCTQWKTREFFASATPDDVTNCLAAGADPNALDHTGTTPLQYAAWLRKEPATLETLIAAGADPEVRDRHGYTLLHLAAQNDEGPDVVRFLLERGADPSARTRSGDTPLSVAASGWSFLVNRKSQGRDS